MQSNTSDSTSSSLLARVKVHDPVAWKRLTESYSPLVYSWCRQFAIPSQDCPDLLQEVFRAVHRSIPDFEHEGEAASFRGWLWTITRNKVRDHYRGHGRHVQAAGGTDAHKQLQELPESPPEPESASDSGRRSLLVSAIDGVQNEFEPTTLQAFWRTTVEGVSSQETARELGMSPGAVRKAKFRVLRRLREVLEGLTE